MLKMKFLIFWNRNTISHFQVNINWIVKYVYFFKKSQNNFFLIRCNISDLPQMEITGLLFCFKKKYHVHSVWTEFCASFLLTFSFCYWTGRNFTCLILFMKSSRDTVLGVFRWSVCFQVTVSVWGCNSSLYCTSAGPWALLHALPVLYSDSLGQKYSG